MRVSRVLLATMVLLGGCGVVVQEEPAIDVPIEEPPVVEEEPPDLPSKCLPAVVGEEYGPVESIYTVVGGELGDVCFGESSEVLEEAWHGLATVTPAEQLQPLRLLAGFDGAGDTLAFTAFADSRRVDVFLVAVDLVSAEDYPAETQLTMVHELAHVFTQMPDQLDVNADPEQCDTFWNGAGCFYPDSYMGQWIEDFWTQDELFAQPEDGTADEDLGEERCELDPGYLGSYAAGSPEEDFAESFSAFVFDLAVPAKVEPKIDWFEAFPDLAEFRELQRSSGIPDVPNPFDVCG
jgi:hypothetical protein